jgi:hypothetical protein
MRSRLAQRRYIDEHFALDQLPSDLRSMREDLIWLPQIVSPGAITRLIMFIFSSGERTPTTALLNWKIAVFLKVSRH